MPDDQKQMSTGKSIVLLVIVAIVTSVVVTLLQVLSLGSSNPAVTGGVVGAITALLAYRTIRKKPN
jgi:flagellar basal body-associated protein FliL